MSGEMGMSRLLREERTENKYAGKDPAQLEEPGGPQGNWGGDIPLTDSA